jgi:chitinase
MSLSRKTKIRATALAVAAPLAVGGVLLATTTNALAAPVFPTHYAAPYLQISTSDQGDMTADMSATGLKYYTLAFLTPKSGCTPEWENGGYGVGQFNSQIDALQAAGGNVIVSFGGAQGGELAQTCTSVSSLTAAYANVVNTTGATRLDFDIEGGVLSDTSATSLRDQALAALQAEDPAVQVDFTLAVNPTGLPTGSGSEYALLQDAKSKGVKVSMVNIMTMDFGDGQNALADAESAAQATAGQLASLYGISSSAAYGMMGLTPIAGQNDDNEDFTIANANTLESFATSKGVGELSFWEVDEYDKPTGYQYSSIFNKITGSGGGTTAPTAPPTGSLTIQGANSGLCLSVTGASKAADATADIYTCNGSVSENWTVNSNGTITGNNSGLCLSVTGDSSALKSTADINTCDGDTYEKWTVESNGTIVNGDGQCLSVTGASTANYATADLYTCNGSVSENWTES